MQFENRSRFPIHAPSRIKALWGRSGLRDGESLQAPPKPASVRASFGLPPAHLKWVRWCALLLALVYFVRGTILPKLSPVPAAGWTMINYLALFVVVGIVLVGGGRWRWSWIMVMLAFSANIVLAEDPRSAGLHWIGLALLMLAVGPVIRNPVAIAVRSATWRFTINGLICLTGIFCVWYALHLPCPAGRFPFAAFMNQSMMLGPIAGMGVVIALARAIHNRSWWWGLFAILGLIPLLASGSRLAALATCPAGLFILFRHKPALGGLVAILFLAAVYGFVAQGDVGQESSLESGAVTGALAYKGTKNSRASLWEDRISDFKSSPIIGVGIALGTESEKSEAGGGSVGGVEPGSSYLAVLSMTGAVGTAAFFLALGLLLFRFIGSHQKGGVDRDVLSVIGIYLAVHGVAEGWILGFGSPLCFLFWLWLGNVGDAVLQPSRAIAKRGMPTLQRLRSSHPALQRLTSAP